MVNPVYFYICLPLPPSPAPFVTRVGGVIGRETSFPLRHKITFVRASIYIVVDTGTMALA